MILECKVLCVKRENGAIEELDTEEDVFLDTVIDLSMATAVKMNGGNNYQSLAVVYFYGEIWVIDRPYEEVKTLFLQSRKPTTGKQRVKEMAEQDHLI